jgi:hypothetical protein
MADVQNRDTLLSLINLIDNAIVTHADAPTLAAAQFGRAWRSGLKAERANGVAHLLIPLWAELPQFLLGAP